MMLRWYQFVKNRMNKTKGALPQRVLNQSSVKNSPVKVIMLSGWMQSGKDTVGNYLMSKGWTRFAFADSLKDELSEKMNIPRDWMNTQEGKKRLWEGKSVRQHLIEYGQTARNKNPNIWVEKTCNHIENAGVDKVVITDWRMRNEFTYVANVFGKDNVYRCRVNRWQEPPLKDITETELDTFEFDVIIANEGTVKDLHTCVDNDLLCIVQVQ